MIMYWTSGEYYTFSVFYDFKRNHQVALVCKMMKFSPKFTLDRNVFIKENQKN